jgi:four helix bundle protein
MRKIIEDRLISLAAGIISLKENRENSEIADHLFLQIMRSSTSAALNYGEALGAETRKDFTHKVGIVLKELHETYNNLRIIKSSNLVKEDKNQFKGILDECNQLISIFHKTVLTLKNKG